MISKVADRWTTWICTTYVQICSDHPHAAKIQFGTNLEKERDPSPRTALETVPTDAFRTEGPVEDGLTADGDSLPLLARWPPP